MASLKLTRIGLRGGERNYENYSAKRNYSMKLEFDKLTDKFLLDLIGYK